jgi:hypothetical protein
MTSTSVLLVAASDELRPDNKVWGTGGWLAPEAREALDWLTFCRLSGWDVVISPPRVEVMRTVIPQGCRWVIIACDPAAVGSELVTYLQRLLNERPITILARSAMHGDPISELADTFIAGERVLGAIVRESDVQSNISEVRPETWALPLDHGTSSQPWAFIRDIPVITERKVGKGAIFSLGFHPSAVRDESDFATALLRQILVEACKSPLAWLDFTGTMILRMDDPGSAQNVYLQSWSYPELDETQWLDIGNILRKHRARLSIGYCSGWVDDGDSGRGLLLVDGKPIDRSPGRVHDAPRVVYSDENGLLPGTLHDFAGEYRAIRALQNRELVDVELHGYTHMYPDSEKWAGAIDRYKSTRWYRELGNYALTATLKLPTSHHPIILGARTLQHFFGVRPTTLISPGDEWTDEALEFALSEGLVLVSSYYLAVRYNDHFCWSQHVCAPYLDEPSEIWFRSGLPVIGYFHDREPSIYGSKWLEECLAEWIKVGVTTFISFRDMAFMLDLKLDTKFIGETVQVSLLSGSIPPITTPIRLRIHVPKSTSNFPVHVIYEGKDCPVIQHWADQTTMSIEVSLP